MRGIFISYRRDDAEGQAGRLFDDLSAHFGRDFVFMDVAGIKKGLDFRRIIDEHVSSCGVLLVIIGKRWLSAADSTGARRLDDANDFVRLETASALNRDIPVIPVLVQDAAMPREQDLPPALKELAFRNGTELTHARWESDVKLLIEDLKPYVDLPATAATNTTSSAAVASSTPTQASRVDTGSGSSRRWPWIGGIAALLIAGAAAFGYASWQERRAEEERVRIAQQAAQAQVAEEQRKRDEADAAQAAAAKAAAQKEAEDKRLREEAERAAAEKSAAEQRKRDADRAAKLAAEQAAANKAAADKAVADKAAADRAAAEKAAADRAAADRAAADRAAADRAAADRAAADRAAADRAAALRAAAADHAAAAAARAGVCVSGYVWREANPNDRVCVTPATRAQAASDNAQAAARRQPGGGPYGPNTCRQGYVWREAYRGDVVCVTPEVRSATARDNAQASARVVR